MVKFIFPNGSIQVLHISRERLNSLNKGSKSFSFPKVMQDLCHDMKASTWKEMF